MPDVQVVALTERYKQELRDAINITLQIARENLAPENQRQIAACDTLEDFVTHYLE
jgi:hypothetical protein